jgi:hypothetical protein
MRIFFFYALQFITDYHPRFLIPHDFVSYLTFHTSPQASLYTPFDWNTCCSAYHGEPGDPFDLTRQAWYFNRNEINRICTNTYPPTHEYGHLPWSIFEAELLGVRYNLPYFPQTRDVLVRNLPLDLALILQHKLLEFLLNANSTYALRFCWRAFFPIGYVGSAENDNANRTIGDTLGHVASSLSNRTNMALGDFMTRLVYRMRTANHAKHISKFIPHLLNRNLCTLPNRQYFYLNEITPTNHWLMLTLTWFTDPGVHQQQFLPFF